MHLYIYNIYVYIHANYRHLCDPVNGPNDDRTGPTMSPCADGCFAPYDVTAAKRCWGFPPCSKV